MYKKKEKFTTAPGSGELFKNLPLPPAPMVNL